jgi:sugar lactone lactonase YvrE
VPDGMKVDTAGNVYCGGAGGIYILDPKGTSRSHLGLVNLKIAGIPVPPPKKA